MRTIFICAGTLLCLFPGCFFPLGEEADPECSTDDDCAHLGGDTCNAATCQSGYCALVAVRGTEACQCHDDGECGQPSGICESLSCVDYQCERAIAPAGPAPQQEAGDCSLFLCDGTSAQGATEIDASDVPEDGNACTVDRCGPAGPEHETLADSTPCGTDGMCFAGGCLEGCEPANPTACGGEGTGEPHNDSAGGALSLGRQGAVCGMLDGGDVDWYTMHLDDDSFFYDVLELSFWSTAPTLEACVYVTCGNGGYPEGGCADKVAGPNGALGCCWQGAPASLSPSWDLDCQGTSEDGGTAYLSVRAPGGSACERYAMTAHY